MSCNPSTEKNNFCILPFPNPNTQVFDLTLASLLIRSWKQKIVQQTMRTLKRLLLSLNFSSIYPWTVSFHSTFWTTGKIFTNNVSSWQKSLRKDKSWAGLSPKGGFISRETTSFILTLQKSEETENNVSDNHLLRDQWRRFKTLFSSFKRKKSGLRKHDEIDQR